MVRYLIEIVYRWENLVLEHTAYFLADSTLDNHWNFKLMEFVGTPPEQPIWYREGEPGGDFLNCRKMFVCKANVAKIDLEERTNC